MSWNSWYVCIALILVQLSLSLSLFRSNRIYTRTQAHTHPTHSFTHSLFAGGSPEEPDFTDLQKSTVYDGGFTPQHPTIQWVICYAPLRTHTHSHPPTHSHSHTYWFHITTHTPRTHSALMFLRIICRMFWQVMQEMTLQQKKAFLRYILSIYLSILSISNSVSRFLLCFFSLSSLSRSLFSSLGQVLHW